MKVLITGGSGFIGTNLVDYYLSKGIEVVNLDIAPPKNAKHELYWRKADLLDLDALRVEVARFSPLNIVNLAAQTGTTDKGRKLEDYATNFRGLKNLAEIAKGVPSVKRLISASTMLVCRSGYMPRNDTDYCPDTLYGQSKMLGEKILREAGDLPYSWTIVRPTGIWGPWFGVPYLSLFRLIQKSLYVHPANSRPVQSLGFVGNTVRQIDILLRASHKKVHGRTFYLADYPPTDMWAWAGLIQKTFNARRVREVPVWALRAVAKVGDALKSAGWDVPLLSSSRLRNMLASFVVDLNPVVAEDPPYSLRQAVKLTVDWLRRSE